MPGDRTPSAGGSHPTGRQALGRKVLRYAAGSVVATVCSEVAFLVMYGAVHASPPLSSTIGWAAGAIPNYWLNRSWTWQRRGKPSLTREVLPYLAIIVGTVVLAAFATSVADRILDGTDVSSGVRLVLVGGTFLGVYALVFVVRFFLLDRLFTAPLVRTTPGKVDPMSAKESV